MGINRRHGVRMTETEVAAYLEHRRVTIIASIGSDGTPHVVPMWYAIIDGTLWFHTKAKSQKVRNLLRSPVMTVLVEDGDTYDQLRGVSMDGRGVVVDDPAVLWQVGVNTWERYTGPYSEDDRLSVEQSLRKRVAIRFDVERTRSWDHAKLGMDRAAVRGSTADHLDERRW